MENTVTVQPTALKPSLVDFFHCLMNIYLETFQRICVRKVACIRTILYFK